MFAWSSLSLTSHFKCGGTMMRWKRSGCIDNHSVTLSLAFDITENRADWFTIRSSRDGGSKKAMKCDRERLSSLLSVGAARSSISMVKTSESSSLNARRNTAGK